LLFAFIVPTSLAADKRIWLRDLTHSARVPRRLAVKLTEGSVGLRLYFEATLPPE